MTAFCKFLPPGDKKSARAAARERDAPLPSFLSADLRQAGGGEGWAITSSPLSFHLQVLGLGKSRDKFFWASSAKPWPDLTSRGEITELKILLKSNMIHCPEKKWRDKSEVACSVGINIQWPVYLATVEGYSWNIEVSRSSYHGLFGVTSPIPILLPLSTLLPCLPVLHYFSPNDVRKLWRTANPSNSL